MANAEQLEILKQGVEVWNKWRAKNHDVDVDLSGASLNGADLKGADLFEANLEEASLTRADLPFAKLIRANLKRANLWGAKLHNASLPEADMSEADLRLAHLAWADLEQANFGRADLRQADLQQANFGRADFRQADLREANLGWTNLWRAKFTEANLSKVNFSKANLKEAELTGANLRYAYLREANLTGAKLVRSDFLEAEVVSTIFANSDLSEAIGLEHVVHSGPSIISIDTFVHSKGKIPEVFLRGCGLSDADIEYAKLSNADLSNDEINKILYRMYDLRAGQALQISPLFISYSHADGIFVDKLESQLNKKGIRFWRDVHDATAGPLEEQIGRAIRLNPTVLLILSEHSIKSDWVEHEVRTARELGKEMKRHVLCPVALDDSWKDGRWPKRVMEQIMEYNILDFSAWEDDSKFEGMFRKLIDGLELFYKG